MGQIFKEIRKSSLLLIFICVVGAVSSNAVQSLPAEMHRQIIKGIGLIYSEQFKQAEKVFNRISRKWPENPVGFFFRAATIDATMHYYGTNDQEQSFFELCDRTIRVGERNSRRNPEDLWSPFFVGGARGYKGVFDARFKRWISAFRNGFEGISILKSTLNKDPSFIDAKMGIGTYYYWRSKLTKTMWWLPGVKDNREEGIKMLREAMEKGIYTKEVSATNLIDIYIAEKKYNEGLAVAERMLSVYPDCRTFLWGKAECLFNLGKLKEAEKIYSYILDTSEASSNDNHFNVIKCRYYLARIYFKQGFRYKTIAECNRILRYVLDKRVKEHLGDIIPETGKLLKKCER